jgi:hypothetical protein
VTASINKSFGSYKNAAVEEASSFVIPLIGMIMTAALNYSPLRRRRSYYCQR